VANNLKWRLAIAIVLIAWLNGGFALASQYRSADVQSAIKDLKSEDQEIRHGAAYHLSEMGAEAKEAVPQLIEVLQSDPSMGIRGEAASALGKIGPAASAAVPAIIAFLKDKQGGYERTYAASALGAIAQQPEIAVPALIDALKNDGEPVVRRLSARALADFGVNAKAAIPPLIEAIGAGDKELREAAAYGLRKIPAGASDIPALIKLLDDEIDVVREAAARSLGEGGSEAVGAVPKLMTLLDDKNSTVREAAAVALGGIGPEAKAAVPALKRSLSDAEIRNEAADALSQIGKKR
jgi:HEAT repeat protein